jgi:hypothetical protein
MKVSACFAMILALAVVPAFTRAQCPQNTVLISVESTSNGNQVTTNYRCRPVNKLSFEDLDHVVMDNLSSDGMKWIQFLRELEKTGRRAYPLQAPITNDASDRSAYNYFQVIEEFRVEEAPRYMADDWTYCNIYLWDVTSAMGAEIPHWTRADDPNGDPVAFTGDKTGLQEMTVNLIVPWLAWHGRAYGWRRVDLRMAQEMAEAGHPSIAIAANRNLNASGHVAVIRPASVGDPRGAAISQAGGLVLDASHIAENPNFTDTTKLYPIQYWVHD